MFNFNFDKRTMYIIIGIMLVFLVVQYATNPSQLLGLLLSAPGVLIAITFHEFAHGYAAYKLGDDTAKRQGRLSLNPFAHLDPIGTLMLLVAGFGKRRSNSFTCRTINELYTCNNIYINILCNIQICRNCFYDINCRNGNINVIIKYNFNKHWTWCI